MSTGRKKRLAAAIAVTLLTTAYFAVPWRDAGPAAQFAGVPLLLLFIVMLPGYALRGFLAPRVSDTLETVAGSFLAGLSFFLIVAFVAAVAGMPLAVFEKILPLPVLGLAVLGLWRAGRAQSVESGPHHETGRRWSVIFSLALVTVFILVLRAGAPADDTKDTLDHVGYINEIAETGQAFPKTAFYYEDDANGRDIRKGLLHFFYGYVSHFLGIAPLRVLDIMGAVFAVILMLAVYSLALGFFGDSRVAVISALLFVLTPKGGLADPAIRLAFYPNRFGLAFLFYFLIHAMDFIDRKNTRDLRGAAFFAFGAGAVHIFFTVAIVCAGVVIKVWKICFPQHSWREHLRRVATLGIVVVASLIPYAVYRYITASPQANDLHTDVQGVLFITDRLFIGDPIRLARWFGPVGLLTFLAVVPLWRQRGEFVGLGYLAASLLTVPLVLLNPLLFPILHGIMTYLASRLMVLSPFYVLTAFFLVRVFDRRSSTAPVGVSRYILAGLLLGAIAVQLGPLFGTNAFSRARVESERARSYLRWQDGLDFLAGMPGRAVIAADPLTSYSIPAFTPHYVACTLDQHAPPNDLRLEERIRAVRDVLSPFVPMRRTLELADKHGITHVILNEGASRRMLVHYWSMDPAVLAAARDKFERYPQLFDVVYDTNGFVVFRRTDEVAATEEVPDNPYRLASVPEGFRQIRRQAGEATLEAFRMDRSEFASGESIDIHFVWSTGRRHQLDNYVVAVRFDHLNTGLPFGGRPLPKIARKLKERITGRLYRFRVEHKMVGGLLGPDTWSPGELILDESVAVIPTDVAPGQYAISVKLLAVANHPNYRLRDLFFDDDVYQGIPVGRISIR
ncbi:MAG: hypothetical protein V3V49_08880 [Candidatus Krumholzibacteria bacterium]